MDRKELYLKTMFCCMSCDGEIAQIEVERIKSMASQTDFFNGMDIEAILNEYVSSINKDGILFLKRYLSYLSETNLTQEEEMGIVDLSFKIIESDNIIKYSEVKFFKKIRARLSISDEQIFAKYPEKEDFLLPDIQVNEDPKWDNVVFGEIKFADHVG
ncbi:MAG: TerB family tellurite resistance protein [Prevotella sp.]|nr:TerB family tellurite resistance protein [Prevotella sp.]